MTSNRERVTRRSIVYLTGYYNLKKCTNLNEYCILTASSLVHPIRFNDSPINSGTS